LRAFGNGLASNSGWFGGVWGNAANAGAALTPKNMAMRRRRTNRT
jgi:hypothetical protein